MPAPRQVPSSSILSLNRRSSISAGWLRPLLCTAMALAPPAAWSQPQPPPTPSEAPPPAVGLPQPFPLVFGIFDLSGVHTFPATVAGTSGTMSSTFLTGRVAPVIRVNPKLYLSVPLDGSISSYDFRGDSGLLPNGGVPWDQVRTYALGLQGRYRIDNHWVLLGEVNVASAGARGAAFEDTLSVGGTFGASYRFSPDLNVGVLLTVQTRLARSLFVLPVPTVEWVLPFDERRWRLVAGGLRSGPGEPPGSVWPTHPLQQLSLHLGLVLVGLGREFRLPADSPIQDGVGRDSALPLLAGIDWKPTRLLHLTLWGGVSVQRAVAVLDRDGNIVRERDLNPAPILGGTISLGL